MRRLYFLLPDTDSAKKIVDELLHAHIEERHIHFIAKDGISLENLPEAGLVEKSDVIPALERGISYGGATGFLAGIIAVTFPPAGLTLGGAAILGITLAGTGFGALMSTMIGVDVPNSRISQFQDAINDGQLLMMVDVPLADVDVITELVKQHHPEANVRGADATIPLFP
jgi:hypothetical protein